MEPIVNPLTDKPLKNGNITITTKNLILDDSGQARESSKTYILDEEGKPKEIIDTPTNCKITWGKGPLILMEGRLREENGKTVFKPSKRFRGAIGKDVEC